MRFFSVPNFGFSLLALVLSISGLAWGDNLYVQSVSGGVLTMALVDCQIDHRETKCPLDTGSAFLLTSAPIDSLKDSVVVGHQDSMGIGSVPSSCDLVSVGSLMIGSRDFGSQIVKRCATFPGDLSPSIGNVVFNGKVVTLDFPNQKMAWNQSEDLTGPAKNKFHRDDQNGWITIETKIGSERLMAFFDTGSHLSVIDQKYVAAHPDSFVFMQELNTTDSSGHVTSQRVYATEPISADGKVFHSAASNVVVATDFSYIQKFLGADVHFILGMNDIQELIWTFDFKNNHWGATKPQLDSPPKKSKP